MYLTDTPTSEVSLPDETPVAEWGANRRQTPLSGQYPLHARLSRPSLSDMTDTHIEEPTEDVAPGQNTPSVQGGPTVSLGEAVRTTGKAKTTLQRRLAENAIPGAVRLPSGGWSIPISGLIAAGLAPKVSPADTATHTPMKRASQIDEAYAAHPIDEPDEYELLEISTAHPYPDPSEVAELRAELDRARQREVAARQRAELLEANLLDARTNLLDLRHTIEDLRRALPPGPTTPSAVVTPTPRRRWWSNK